MALSCRYKVHNVGGCVYERGAILSEKAVETNIRELDHEKLEPRLFRLKHVGQGDRAVYRGIVNRPDLSSQTRLQAIAVLQHQKLTGPRGAYLADPWIA